MIISVFLISQTLHSSIEKSTRAPSSLPDNHNVASSHEWKVASRDNKYDSAPSMLTAVGLSYVSHVKLLLNVRLFKCVFEGKSEEKQGKVEDVGLYLQQPAFVSSNLPTFTEHKSPLHAQTPPSNHHDQHHLSCAHNRTQLRFCHMSSGCLIYKM